MQVSCKLIRVVLPSEEESRGLPRVECGELTASISPDRPPRSRVPLAVLVLHHQPTENKPPERFAPRLRASRRPGQLIPTRGVSEDSLGNALADAP